jgi:hypothetical protein
LINFIIPTPSVNAGKSQSATANVDYHLSFADQGKQTLFFNFPRRKQMKSSKQTEVAISVYIYFSVFHLKR